MTSKAINPESRRQNGQVADALQVLRADYQRRVEQLAEELRSRFESGELRGWRSGDGERGRPDPRRELEDVAERHFARGAEQVRATIFLSPSAPKVQAATDGDGLEITAKDLAAESAALDVLAVAKARGWVAVRGRRSAA